MKFIICSLTWNSATNNSFQKLCIVFKTNIHKNKLKKKLKNDLILFFSALSAKIYNFLNIFMKIIIIWVILFQNFEKIV